MLIMSPTVYCKKKRSRDASMMIAWLACMTLYSAHVVLHPTYSLDAVNVILVGASLCAVAIALSHMLSHGVRVWSVFIALWFAFLALNGLNLSEMQTGKSVGDLYYLVALPLLFAAVIAPVERREIPFFKNPGGPSLAGFGLIDAMALLVIAVYIFFRFAFVEQTGMRFLTAGFGAESPELIGADGSGSGLVSLLMWLVVLLGSSARSKRVRRLSMVVVGLSCLLFLKRGVVVKIVLYYFLFYLGKKGLAAFSKKGFVVFLVAALVGCSIFAAWGDVRQHARGAGSDYSIGERIEARIDDNVASWVYAYTSLNYDVLKQCYIDQAPTGQFEELLKPVTRILLGGEIYERMDDGGSGRDLNGFNAPTFLGPFVRESGLLSCISVLLLGLMIRIVVAFSFKVGSSGVYYLVMSLASLAFFSNSFTSPYIVYAIIITLGASWLDRYVKISSFGLQESFVKRACNGSKREDRYR